MLGCKRRCHFTSSSELWSTSRYAHQSQWGMPWQLWLKGRSPACPNAKVCNLFWSQTKPPGVWSNGAVVNITTRRRHFSVSCSHSYRDGSSSSETPMYRRPVPPLLWKNKASSPRSDRGAGLASLPMHAKEIGWWQPAPPLWSVEDYHRHLIVLQLLELVDGEISKRFKQESLEVPQTIEKLLLGSLTGGMEPPSVPTKLQDLYHCDLTARS